MTSNHPNDVHQQCKYLAGIINLTRENNYKCIFSRDAVIREIFLIHYKIKREKGAMNGRKET